MQFFVEYGLCGVCHSAGHGVGIQYLFNECDDPMLKCNSEDKHRELKDVPRTRNIPDHPREPVEGGLEKAWEGCSEEAESLRKVPLLLGHKLSERRHDQQNCNVPAE